jgi:hypothetical protein
MHMTRYVMRNTEWGGHGGNSPMQGLMGWLLLILPP